MYKDITNVHICNRRAIIWDFFFLKVFWSIQSPNEDDSGDRQKTYILGIDIVENKA